MRKINLIILLATVLIATSLRASGNGSGSTKANSIEFDWTTGVVHSGDKLWYRIDLGSLQTYSQPFFLIHFRNPSLSDTVHFRCETAVLGTTFNFDEDVAPGQEVTSAESSLGSLIAKQESPELFFKMESSGAIHIMCTVIEESYPPSLCDEWNVLGMAYPNGMIRYSTFKQKLTTDTIIAHKHYAKLEQSGKYIGAMREEEDSRIYYIPAGSEQQYLLYAFHAQAGDTLTNTWVGGNPNDFPNGSRAVIKEIKETSPKTYIVSYEYVYNYADTSWMDYTWIEGVGMSCGPSGDWCPFHCAGDYGESLLCAYKNGEQVYVSEDGEEYGCEYNSIPVFISLYKAQNLAEWDGITGITAASRDTLIPINRDEIAAILEGHRISLYQSYELYHDVTTQVQLFDLRDNSIVYTDSYQDWKRIHLSIPSSYMIVLKPENEEGILLGRVDFEVIVESLDDIPAPSSSATKILRDGQLYIKRDGKMYTIQGIEVK